MADARTYSLTDLGISNDDLGLLLNSGYDLNQVSGISEAKREEILAKIYELKKEKSSKQEENKKLNDAIDELKKSLENASTEEEKKQAVEKFNDTIGTTVYSDHTTAENSSHEEIADRVTSMMKGMEAKSMDGVKTEYNAEDIELLMKQMDIYLQRPDEVQNSDILKAANPNYEETHQKLFAEHVQLCSKIIKDYGEGRIHVTPDAIAPMGVFISKFGKEYIADAKGNLQSHESGNKYDLTSEAQLAGQRLAYEKLNPQSVKTEPEQEQNKDRVAYLQENNRYIRSNVAGQNRTAEQWSILYEYIDHNPTLKTDYDRRKAKEKLDKDFERTANKKAKEAFAEKDLAAVAGVAAAGIGAVALAEDIKNEQPTNVSGTIGDNDELMIDEQVDGVVNQGNEKQEKTADIQQGKTSEQQNTQDVRIRSPHNFTESQRLASKSLDVLADMEIISREDADKNSAALFGEDLAAAQDAFMFVAESEAKVKKPKEYKARVVDKLLNVEDADLLTPELAVFAHQNLQERMKKAEGEEKAALESKLNIVREQMDTLQSNFANDENLYLVDVTNVADAYDGYMHMFRVRSQEIEEENNRLEKEKKWLNKNKDAERIAEIEAEIKANNDKIDSIKQSTEKMDEKVKPFDEMWNIPSGENPKDTSIDFAQRIHDGTKILNDVKFDEETLGKDILETVSNFKFTDNEGKPIPQFVDPTKDENDPARMSDVWKPGMVVAPDSQLETVLQLAGNDVLMQNLGSKEKLNKEFMVEQLKDRIPFKLFEIHNEDAIRNHYENPDKFTSDKDQEFANFEQQLKEGVSISPQAYSSAIDRQVNQVEVYANRLDSKLGRANTHFIKAKLFDQIKKIDKKAKNRGMSVKQAKAGSIKRSLLGAGVTLGVGYLAGRTLGNIVGTGGVGAVSNAVALGAAVTISTGVAIWQIHRKKKQAKAEGKKYGWKEFKKDKMFHAQLATSALAIGSAAICCVNAPEMAGPAIAASTACIAGSMSLGAASRMVQVYKDNRISGHGRVVSGLLGAVNGMAAVGGSLWGRHDAMTHDVTPTQHQEGVNVSEGPDVKTYSDDHIQTVTDRNNANSMYEYTGEGPHDIPAYRNPDNYTQQNWFTPEQHDNAINALKENMPELGWKEGVGNEEVILRKLAAFERLHRNVDYIIPEGEFAGKSVMEAMGGDYREVLNGLLNGELTPEGAKIIDNIQSVTGADGHSNLIPGLGNDLHSYAPHDTGIGIETTTIETPNMVNDTPEVAGGMFGFGWIKKLKEKFRPGAKADKVEAKAEPQPKPVPPRPKPRPEPPVPPVPPRPEPDPIPPVNPDIEKMLLDEYKIVYGIAPITEEGKNQQWLNYCARVEEERKVAAPDKDMNQFLLDRRAKLDEIVEKNLPHMKNGDTKDVNRIKKDYEIRKAKDTRSHATIIGEVRQSLMQSNLTRDNYINAITLSHFTEYADMTIAGGDAYKHSRNIHLNPKLDRHYQKEESKVKTFDMNAALLGGKHVEGERGAGKDFREHSRKLQEKYER